MIQSISYQNCELLISTEWVGRSAAGFGQGCAFSGHRHYPSKVIGQNDGDRKGSDGHRSSKNLVLRPNFDLFYRFLTPIFYDHSKLEIRRWPIAVAAILYTLEWLMSLGRLGSSQKSQLLRIIVATSQILNFRLPAFRKVQSACVAANLSSDPPPPLSPQITHELRGREGGKGVLVRYM